MKRISSCAWLPAVGWSTSHIDEPMMEKRIALLFGCLLFIIVAGCKQSPKNAKTQKVVKDYFNRTVTIPDKVERVLPIYYVQAEFLCAIGAADKMVGIGKINKNSSEILNTVFPQIHNMPVVGFQNTINTEAVIGLKPDFIFCGTEKETVEKFEQLGYPITATYPNSVAQILDEVLFYGKIVNKEAAAKIIFNFLQSKLDSVTQISRTINKTTFPKVYYVRTDALTTLGGTLQGEVFNLAGGELVTQKLGNNSNSLQMSLEDIYAYNPDVIVIRDRASITPTDIYNDAKWSNIAAVKNKKVFQETYGWTEFRFGTFFGLMEKAKWFHPKKFSALDPAKAYRDFLQLIQQNNASVSK